MALPTLTPQSTTSQVILPETGSAGSVAASLPYSIYSTNTYWQTYTDAGVVDDPGTNAVNAFLSGAADQVGYTYRKLGGDVLDIELTANQVYAAYEEAVLEYSYLINIHQSKNVLSNVLGGTTASFNEDGMIREPKVEAAAIVTANANMNSETNLSLKYPKFDFAYARRVTDGISSEATVGGSQTVYSASFAVQTDQQDYDLQSLILEAANDVANSAYPFYQKLGTTTDASKLLIKKVYFKTPRAMWNFYGYHGGLNVAGNLSTYGQYADDSTFQVVPVWQHKAQAVAYEDSVNTRTSQFSYELRNNRLRIFPVPQSDYPEKMWVEFVTPGDTWTEDSNSKAGITGINNLNTMPLQNIPFLNINSIGKQWIRKFALSMSKEMLGLIRSKFSSIPIPGNEISLNGDALISQAKEEQQALREELKTTLDELTYSKLMEGDVEMVKNSSEVMSEVPLEIYVG